MALRHCVFLLAAGVLAAGAVRGNDSIFPAEGAAAQKAIHWENGYFVVNGRPTFLASGEIHYARVPRELWKDRILRAKAMGFNTIQTYCMWNAHEGKEGTFDFSGNLDLDAWLKTIEECGMYAVVRPGPYVCAEWENGGLPAWLCDKPEMKVRVNDAQYLKYVDRYMARCHEIIAKHQIHKGGSTIMVQLENELPNVWGTDTNAYTRHLYDQARAAGIEVLLVNSGVHHGDDPAGTRPFGNRTMPWYVTEFWTGWIGLTGDMNAQKHEEKVRGTWKIIGFGGAGYDYYVVHGGSNFGYSKGAEVTASYDYAAPIGEAGQLRRSYFPMKRAAMFATAFDDLLTSSKDGTAFVASNSANVQTFARTSPVGNAIFLADAPRFQNTGRGGRGGRGAGPAPVNIATQIKLADGRTIPSGTKTLSLMPGEIRPILTDVLIHQDPKDPEAKPLIFDYAATGILTRIKLRDTTYVVCYGTAGEEGEIAVKGRPAPLSFTFPSGDVVTPVDITGTSVKLLVMNTDLADRTWITGSGDARALVIGPHYVSPEGDIEAPTKNITAVVYSAAGRKEAGTPLHDVLMPLPKLEKWQVREGAGEALPGTDVSKWPLTKDPKPMEQYDDYANGWGWYRSTIKRDAAGPATLRFTGAGDIIRVFLNGQRVAGDKTGAQLDFKAGDNEVAVLCWNEGRPKMYNFTGPTGLMAAKGIWGPVMIVDKPLASLATWRVLNTPAVTATDNAPAAAAFDDSGWAQTRFGGNTVNSRVGYAWFRTTFDAPEGGGQCMLLHQGIDDEGEFFLNGEPVGKHIGWNIGGTIDLSKTLKPGKNVLAVRVKNNDGSGGIAAAIDIVSMKGNQENWRFHPGLDMLQETPLIATVTNWKDFLATSWNADPTHPRMPNLPTFHRADFTYSFDKNLRQPISLRTTGLRAGSVWINGHNIGPYRNTGNNAAEMYVPECWLNEGPNTLIIFDAEGAAPAQATLVPIETWVKTRLPK